MEKSGIHSVASLSVLIQRLQLVQNMAAWLVDETTSDWYWDSFIGWLWGNESSWCTGLFMVSPYDTSQTTVNCDKDRTSAPPDSSQRTSTITCAVPQT